MSIRREESRLGFNCTLQILLVMKFGVLFFWSSISITDLKFNHRKGCTSAPLSQKQLMWSTNYSQLHKVNTMGTNALIAVQLRDLCFILWVSIYGDVTADLLYIAYKSFLCFFSTFQDMWMFSQCIHLGVSGLRSVSPSPRVSVFWCPWLQDLLL